MCVCMPVAVKLEPWSKMLSYRASFVPLFVAALSVGGFVCSLDSALHENEWILREPSFV